MQTISLCHYSCPIYSQSRYPGTHSSTVCRPALPCIRCCCCCVPSQSQSQVQNWLLVEWQDRQSMRTCGLMLSSSLRWRSIQPASQPATSRPESAVHRHRRAVERLLMHHRDTTNNSIAVDFDCFTLSTSVPGKPKAMPMMACQVSRPWIATANICKGSLSQLSNPVRICRPKYVPSKGEEFWPILSLLITLENLWPGIITSYNHQPNPRLFNQVPYVTLLSTAWSREKVQQNWRGSKSLEMIWWLWGECWLGKFIKIPKRRKWNDPHFLHTFPFPYVGGQQNRSTESTS